MGPATTILYVFLTNFIPDGDCIYLFIHSLFLRLLFITILVSYVNLFCSMYSGQLIQWLHDATRMYVSICMYKTPATPFRASPACKLRGTIFAARSSLQKVTRLSICHTDLARICPQVCTQVRFACSKLCRSKLLVFARRCHRKTPAGGP